MKNTTTQIILMTLPTDKKFSLRKLTYVLKKNLWNKQRTNENER